jgi:4'-phosphopantetheinyl transferase
MWWLARGERDLPRDESWLSDAEAAYANRQRFAKRRTEFLVARWTAKQALRVVLSLPVDGAGLRRVEVRHASTGAPFACVDGTPVDARISLTDRAGWAVCLVAESGPIGCDLELVEARSQRFVHDFFTTAERDYVESAADPDLAANLVWSAKESALKVLETGLRRDTRSVEVSVAPPSGGWSALTATTAERSVFPGWWQRFGDFVLTVAVSARQPAPTGLDEPSPLHTARPEHSWLRRPLTSGTSPDRASR